ncbi:DUF3027 domain-containing protein [Glycomyces albidus]|uniref:DUF4351 domain-containing protein n=1 Tax=Glycomyces albidus TaxID=2656774 RepID=A0A6L5G5N7_9ACTN|nr:hypothetical protein [Glycomyces albidus]MQM24950.1 hypothetical protein [Glycomyces albidus]
MVTHYHEIPIRLFQDRPELAVELLVKTAGTSIPAYASAVPESEALTNCDPIELNCDNVAVFRDGFGKPVYAVITEIQRSEDDNKPYSWPMYLTNLRARLRCQVQLLVICTNEITAKWARQPIKIGPPEFVLRPEVLGPGDLLRLAADYDPREAVELLILVAATYDRGPETESVAHDLGRRLNELSEAERRKYAGWAFHLLSTPACEILEDHMSLTYQEYRESYAGQLEIKGERRGQIGALLKVLEARGINVSESARTRIESVSDEEELDRWFARSVTVDRVEEIFD